MIELTLPYPPSANSIWSRTRKGMRHSDRYARWLEIAGWSAIEQGRRKVPGHYKLSIQATRPDRKKRDLDNLIKPISDLLVGLGIVSDDSLCEMISARWVTTGEGVTVRVEPAGVE